MNRRRCAKAFRLDRPIAAMLRIALARATETLTGCNRLCDALQPVTSRIDSPLHEAGNVIETHEHVGDFKDW